jgi:hypothetical protein
MQISSAKSPRPKIVNKKRKAAGDRCFKFVYKKQGREVILNNKTKCHHGIRGDIFKNKLR